MAEERGDVTATVYDVQNQHHVMLYDAVDNHVILGGETAEPGPQIIVTPTPDVRIPRQEPKPLRDALHYAGRDIDAAALVRNANPMPSSSASASGERRNLLMRGNSFRRQAVPWHAALHRPPTGPLPHVL
jgi:hypothetical protein